VVALLLEIFLITSCISTSSYKDLDPDKKAKIDKSEHCYLTKARRKAAFLTNCPENSIKTAVGNTNRGFAHVGRTLVTDFPKIQSMNVTACKRKIIFNVFCDVNQQYSTDLELCGCSVIQNSNLQTRLRKKKQIVEKHRQEQAIAGDRRRLQEDLDRQNDEFNQRIDDMNKHNQMINRINTGGSLYP
jgi:hypothetical protein